MRRTLLLFTCLLFVAVGALSAQNTNDAPVTIEILWFDDGNESETLAALLDAYMEQNPNLDITLEISTSIEVNNELSRRIAAGNPPDLARTNIPSSYRGDLLDLRPYLANPDQWAQNFRPDFLAGLREDPASDALHGYPTDLTISAPYINRTLWERAGVPIPSQVQTDPTWEDWITAATQVQAALTSNNDEIYAIAMDATGHRFWGPSLSLCATYVQDFSTPLDEITIDTPGFRTAANMLKSWHKDGLIPPGVWTSSQQNNDPPDRMFIDGKFAFYFSGSWQLDSFEKRIDDFEWEVVPNPAGGCGRRTGMVGGSVMVPFESTDHPEEVGQLVDYLTEYDNLRRFYTENLILPGHTGMIEEELYPGGSNNLRRFQQELANAVEEAFVLQYRPDSFQIHSTIRDGLITMLQDDLTIDETVALIEQELGLTGQRVAAN